MILFMRPFAHVVCCNSPHCHALARLLLPPPHRRYVQPPVLDYTAIFAASAPSTPVVFVLSPGADPAFDVFRLGEEMGFKPGGKLKYLSLGQGAWPTPKDLILFFCLMLFECVIASVGRGRF